MKTHRRGKGHVSLSQRLGVENENTLVLAALSAAVLWIMFVSSWLNSVMIGNPPPTPHKGPHDLMLESPRAALLEVSPIDVWPDNSESMDLFRTFKECDPSVPNSKCLAYVPEGTTTHRVAVLSPPGEVADFVIAWIQAALKFHSNNKTDIALLPTSHVPPYGYGKNHGYTKIIRVAAFPMSLAVADAVRSSANGGAFEIGIADMKQVARQVVRWQCRLSHVAAHTSLMTITVADLIEQPYDVEERLCTFLGLTKRDPLEDGFLEGGHMDEDKMFGSLEPMLDDASKLLTQVDQSSHTENMEPVLNSIVEEELKITNDLSAWPCLSFWNVGEEPDPAKITLIARNLAQALSPDCKSKYTTCSVKKDKCEEKGDPVCKG